MANNKIQFANGDVLIDLTGDTVTAESMLAGVTAHDASGALITGTLALPEVETATIETPTLDMDNWVCNLYKYGPVITLVMQSRPTSQITKNVWTAVATIPSGFRPRQSLYYSTITHTGVPMDIFINANGALQFRTYQNIKDYHYAAITYFGS